MNFQKFKKHFIMELEAIIAEKYPDYALEVMRVEKIGITKTGIMLKQKDKVQDGHYNVYYIENIFNEFKGEKKDVRAYAEEFIPWFFKQDFYNDLDFSKVANKDFLLNNLYLQVVNYDLSKNLLKTVPHRRFLDLAIVYRFLIKNDIKNSRLISCLITNDNSEAFKLTEEDLYMKAMTNTDKILMPRIIDNILTGIESSYGSSFLVSKNILKVYKENLVIVPINTDRLFVMPIRLVKDLKGLKEEISERATKELHSKDEDSLATFMSANLYFYNYADDTVAILDVFDPNN